MDLHIRYKSETGYSPFFTLESEHLTQSLDGNEFQGMTSREIIDAIEYDFIVNAGWGIFISKLHNEFQDNDDLKIYSQEYVDWLESLVNALQHDH